MSLPAVGEAGHRRAAPYHAGMGFNPFRPQEKSVVDVIVVVTTLLVTLGLVLWALLSG